MTTEKSKEWWEGFNARRAGKPGIPPYPLQSQQGSDWAEGWHSAAN